MNHRGLALVNVVISRGAARKRGSSAGTADGLTFRARGRAITGAARSVPSPAYNRQKIRAAPIILQPRVSILFEVVPKPARLFERLRTNEPIEATKRAGLYWDEVSKTWAMQELRRN
ncbi:MAG TPA: hypothetical protein VHT48_02450 [Methylocella sp.]|jgi:hypothetical protein|nr:hypothetical protein [Methylocella sp.]